MKEPRSLKELGIEGEVVLCFSGGIDSFVGRHYLGIENVGGGPVYFDLHSRYSKKERTYIRRNFRNTVIDNSLSWLGKYEEGEKAFVPYRNLYLAMTASIKYAPNVCICGVEDDVVEDKNQIVFDLWSKHLSEIGRKRVRIFSPFWEMTKVDIVRWYLNTGGTEKAILNTVSCYSPGRENYCGRCPSCFRKWVALRANGVDISFHNIELVKEYYVKCLRGEYEQSRNESTLQVIREAYSSF